MKVLEESAARCTLEGEIFKQSEYRKVFDLSAEKAAALAENRKELDKDALRRKLAKVLSIGKLDVPYYRILRPGRQFDGKCEIFARWGLETEPERVMAVLKLYNEFCYNYIPDADEATLYIPHLDADVEVHNDGGFNRKEFLFALDVRCVGELKPSGCDRYSRKFFGQYLFDYHFASLGVMFNKPILGGKVRDILCALELLKANGVRKITLKAEGQGTIPALIAAFLSDIPDAVELNNMPESWQSMAEKQQTLWPMSAMAYGILGVTDFDVLRKHIKNLKYTVASEPQQD